jgi:hypothetical protein
VKRTSKLHIENASVIDPLVIEKSAKSINLHIMQSDD